MTSHYSCACEGLQCGSRAPRPVRQRARRSGSAPAAPPARLRAARGRASPSRGAAEVQPRCGREAAAISRRSAAPGRRMRLSCARRLPAASGGTACTEAWAVKTALVAVRRRRSQPPLHTTSGAISRNLGRSRAISGPLAPSRIRTATLRQGRGSGGPPRRRTPPRAPPAPGAPRESNKA